MDDLTAFPPNSDWPTGHLFAAAARLSMPVAWRIIGQHGISPVGFYLLRLLIVDDGLRPGEAAKRLVVTPRPSPRWSTRWSATGTCGASGRTGTGAA